MRFAQFFHMSVPGEWNNHKSSPIEACGDRSVFILDARNRLVISDADARVFGKRHDFCGYTIHEGKSFSTNRLIQPYREL